MWRLGCGHRNPSFEPLGVRSSASLEFRSEPISTRSFTTPTQPFEAANDSGVRPKVSLEPRSRPFSTRSLTTRSWSLHAAHASGVRPSLSPESELILLSSRC
ncbi:hypothetical protein BDV12DRAFT_191725 [Aspergillus spectabilis]